MTPPFSQEGQIGLNEPLTQGLQITATLIQGLLGELRDNSIALAAFNAELKNIKENVTLLSRILKDGNGTESVMTRVSLLEDIIERMQVSIKELDNKTGDLSKAIQLSGKEERLEEIKSKRESRGQRMQFWASILTAVIALAATVIALLVK